MTMTNPYKWAIAIILCMSIAQTYFVNDDINHDVEIREHAK
jgi:hypothetical protein